MRTSAKFSSLAILITAFTLVCFPQQKAVHFKKLQEFLPKTDLPGYTRAKPGGQTSTAMGMSTSEATVKYDKSGTESEEGNTVAISISISDVLGMPMGAIGLAVLTGSEYENETENGYEKSIKVQGYSGKESAETGEYKSAEITLAVADRFIVTLKHEGSSDTKLLRKLLDGMKLSDLAQLAKQ